MKLELIKNIHLYKGATFLKSKSIVKNIITFGANSRIHKSKVKFESLHEELVTLNTEMEIRKKEVNESLLELVNKREKASLTLKEIKKITDKIKGKEREFIINYIKNEKIDLDFGYISEVLELTNMAKSVSTGTSAGLSAGVITSGAVPLLVGQLATASTGTAIGSLSGAAATNATLAWLGGGSIASGGGGMAAGSIILGGLTIGIGLISAAAITSVISHVSANKEIKKIKEKEIEVIKVIDDITKNLLSFDLIEKRCNEIGLSIEKAQEIFTLELEETYKVIYPYKFISKILKQTKKIFHKNYFSAKDVKQIAHLGEIGRNLAKLLETNVIEIK